MICHFALGSVDVVTYIGQFPVVPVIDRSTFSFQSAKGQIRNWYGIVRGLIRDRRGRKGTARGPIRDKGTAGGPLGVNITAIQRYRIAITRETTQHLKKRFGATQKTRQRFKKRSINSDNGSGIQKTLQRDRLTLIGSRNQNAPAMPPSFLSSRAESDVNVNSWEGRLSINGSRGRSEKHVTTEANSH
jgi:hypothetical protein